MKDSIIRTAGLRPGNRSPLGATLKPDGVNFSLFSRHADKVFLRLYANPEDSQPREIMLNRSAVGYWHVFVEKAGPGQLYAFRIEGAYKPDHGLRYNRHMLLLDPYARALSGPCENRDGSLFDYEPSSGEWLSPGRVDSSASMPRCVVVDDGFDWQQVPRPLVLPEETVIYEVHVRGFTQNAAVEHPGTYLGLIEKIPYLKRLGVNTVELLPVHDFHVRKALLDQGLTEYWGYNSVAFFAPAWKYGTRCRPGCQVEEFKIMVRELHRAGIQVILDVVYNHTGEGDYLGPTVCFRGIDNPGYYVLPRERSKKFYENNTGCGNDFNCQNPIAGSLIIDSLYYWNEQMGVDGFRFDLAPVLFRGPEGFSPDVAFSRRLSRKKFKSNIRFIAEPWDVRTYELGNFPSEWWEWNDRYRDTVRRFLKGDPGLAAEFASRVTGSADLFQGQGRTPACSVNFVTCHDGFTLNDLFSYNSKHNESNGEGNRDGSDRNFSWNCGAEGPVDDLRINSLRLRLIRNSILCLVLSLGTPMILGGDELRRTQQGNNNAYCQDNELSWFDWNRLDRHGDVFDFFRQALEFRRYYGFWKVTDYASLKIEWLGPNREKPEWDDSELRTLGVVWHHSGKDPQARRCLVIFNADPREKTFLLPRLKAGRAWFRAADTSLKSPRDFSSPGREKPVARDYYIVKGRSSVVFVEKEGKDEK